MVKRISPQDAQELLTSGRGFTYVDVRTPPEFAAGRPVGSVNIPAFNLGAGGMVPNPQFLEQVSARFSREAPLILGCKSGGRSLRAAELLLAAGFTGVVDQRAGFEGARDSSGRLVEAGWANAGLPVESGS